MLRMASSAIAVAGVAGRTVGKAAGLAATLPEPRSAVRWGLKHGAARVAFRSSASVSEPLARLINDPVLRANPYPFYAEIQRSAAVVPGRTMCLTARHAVISACLRDENMRSGFPTETFPAPARLLLNLVEDRRIADPIARPSMLAANGPEHARYRKLAMRAFTPRAIEGLRRHVDSVAHELLDAMGQKHADGSPADVIAEYAEVLPVLVIAEILGVPADMRPQFRLWATDIVGAAEMGVGYRPYRKSEEAGRALFEWMVEHQRALRDNPGHDLFSRMVTAAAESAGSRAADADERGLVINGALLLFAGFETTVNLIGNGLDLVLRHPDQLHVLRHDPSGWPDAIEEVLRFAPPVQNTFRYPDRDVVLEGVPLRRGQFLGLLLAAANRDPEVFDDPDRFDITRTNAKEHLTFGLGPHFCLGAALARMEGVIAMRALFERFPDLTPAGPPVRRPSRMISGLASYPLLLGKVRAAPPSA